MNYSKSDDNYDWVEILNVSDEEVDLSEYCLSDKKKDLSKYRLPDEVLGPGEYFVFKEMKLDSGKEKVFLSTGDTVCDTLMLENIPYYGSYGRIPGEEGGFYFSKPTEGKANGEGKHNVSEIPISRTKDGIYNDVDSVTVELSGKGTIYYTLNGNLPDENSVIYNEAY